MASVRIIAGTYGGRYISAPPKDNTRTHPMSERARGAIFNFLGNSLEGARVLDAFAGTGALALEAISRGADTAVCIEKDRLAQNLIAENIKNLDVQRSVRLIKTTLGNWLDTRDASLYDIIFADPPYHDTQVTTIQRLEALLSVDGLMILSWPVADTPPSISGLIVTRQKEYAGARIICYERNLSTG